MLLLCLHRLAGEVGTRKRKCNFHDDRVDCEFLKVARSSFIVGACCCCKSAELTHTHPNPLRSGRTDVSKREKPGPGGAVGGSYRTLDAEERKKKVVAEEGITDREELG